MKCVKGHTFDDTGTNCPDCNYDSGYEAAGLENKQKLEALEARHENLRSRADEEVGKLREEAHVRDLQNGSLKAMLNDIRGMVLGARTVHEISDLAARIYRRIEGPDEDAEKREGEKCQGGCGKTVDPQGWCGEPCLPF